MKKLESFDLIGAIRDYFNITPYQDIIEWAEKYINFSDDVSAQRDRLDFSTYPYQVEILKAFEDLTHIKEVVVCAPEQCGKSLIEIVAMLWWMVYCPGQQLVVWPSDDKAAEANLTKIQPLIRKIPGLKEEMDRPRSFRSDRYAFSNCVSYFQGSGAKVMSKSCQLVLGDEVDQYQAPPNVNQIKEMQKRTRSYDHSIVGLVCTPTTERRCNMARIYEGLSGTLVPPLQKLWRTDDGLKPDRKLAV